MTGFEIERLSIEGVDLGPMAVDEVSEYFGVEGAYEGMGFEAVIDGIPFSNTIADRDGAVFLGSGRHTYELLYFEREDRDPALALVADR